MRDLAHGESDFLTWEWSREAPIQVFRRFQYVKDQRAVARYLVEHARGDEDIGVVGRDRALHYLSGRRLVPLTNFVADGRWTDPRRLPRRLLVGPMVGTRLYFRPEGYRWIEENCRLEAQFDRYSIYQVIGPYPPSPQPLMCEYGGYTGHPLSEPFLHVWWPRRR